MWFFAEEETLKEYGKKKLEDKILLMGMRYEKKDFRLGCDRHRRFDNPVDCYEQRQSAFCFTIAFQLYTDVRIYSSRRGSGVKGIIYKALII